MLKRIAKVGFQYAERAARRYGYEVSWRPPVLCAQPFTELKIELEFIIAHFMLMKPDIYFIAIGANDGKSNDPLYKFVVHFGWRGILLEPLPAIFTELESNYAGVNGVKLVNAAVAEHDGQQILYTIRMTEGQFPKAHQFSSLKKDSVLSQVKYVPDVANLIEETKVKCLSFDTLLDMAESPVDILQIDTEGYDGEILKMIDFAKLNPAIINFEHLHMSKAERQFHVDRLISQGYLIGMDPSDTTAYRPITRFSFRAG